jgi:hypothetical protein
LNEVLQSEVIRCFFWFDNIVNTDGELNTPGLHRGGPGSKVEQVCKIGFRSLLEGRIRLVGFSRVSARCSTLIIFLIGLCSLRGCVENEIEL